MAELKDKILKNKEKFLETSVKYEIFNEELLKFLGEDIITAPASTMTSLHNAFPGGLVDHILKTTKYAVGLRNINITYLSRHCLPDRCEVGTVIFNRLATSVHYYVPNSVTSATMQSSSYIFNNWLVESYDVEN